MASSAQFYLAQFTGFIHTRDIAIGRTKDFLVEQLIFAANLVTLPLWVAGLYFYLSPRPVSLPSARLDVCGPIWLFLVAQGRSYYLAARLPDASWRGAILMNDGCRPRLPAARPVWSKDHFWRVRSPGVDPDGAPRAAHRADRFDLYDWPTDERRIKESVGWPEMVETVAGIYAALPAQDRPQAGILTGNYGEARSDQSVRSNLWPAEGNQRSQLVLAARLWLVPPPQALTVIGFEPRGGISYTSSRARPPA